MYQLKKGVESFEVVDGPFAGKKFLRGKTYKDIPPEEKHKFEKIRDQGPGIRDQEMRNNTEPETQKATERSKP
jgi:hypothetical protein